MTHFDKEHDLRKACFQGFGNQLFPEVLSKVRLVVQHIGEITVRETFDFAARCQGAGSKKGKPCITCLECNNFHL